jgi:hypothetical protein
MKYILAIFLCGLVINITAQSAEPVIKVGDLPSDEKLEFFEESEELFSLKLLEYYDKAIALKTQIILLGAEPRTKFSPPSFEELSDQDIELIKKYFRIAKSLEKEVIALPEKNSQKQIAGLRDSLVSERKSNDSIYLAELESYLSSKYNEYFKERINQCTKDNIYKNYVIDSLKFDCLTQLEKQRASISDYYDDFYKNTYPAVSVSGSANKLFFSSDKVQDKLTLNTELLLNLNPLFKYGKYFDIWLAYMMPVFETKSNNPQNANIPLLHKWNSDVYSVGLNGNISEMISLDKLRIGLKLGLGHYWGLGRMPNIVLSDAQYSGQIIKFELNFGNKTVFAPFEVFLAYSTYFNSKDFILQTPTEIINLGKANINNLSLGFRVGIIRTNSID